MYLLNNQSFEILHCYTYVRAHSYTNSVSKNYKL